MALLAYFTGVGRSPVKISGASWYSAATATWPGSMLPPKRSRRITARAWANTATVWECSWMFSWKVLRISPQRLMYRIRER